MSFPLPGGAVTRRVEAIPKHFGPDGREININDYFTFIVPYDKKLLDFELKFKDDFSKINMSGRKGKILTLVEHIVTDDNMLLVYPNPGTNMKDLSDEQASILRDSPQVMSSALQDLDHIMKQTSYHLSQDPNPEDFYFNLTGQGALINVLSKDIYLGMDRRLEGMYSFSQIETRTKLALFPRIYPDMDD